MAFCYIASILRIGCLFTDLGKAWLQMPLMHVKLGLFALYLYHGKCQQIFKQLQNDQINIRQILCAYGTKELPSFFCGSFLVF
jgi:uncharacterized membrane protein